MRGERSLLVPFRPFEGRVDVVAERERQFGRGGNDAGQADGGAIAIRVPTISSMLAPAASAISAFDW